MTKRDLVVKIAEKTGMVQDDVVEVVQETFDGIAAELAKGNTLEFRGFGVFEIVVRKSRVGRNPKKPQETVTIPDMPTVKFKAGQELKAAMAKLSPKKIIKAKAAKTKARKG